MRAMEIGLLAIGAMMLLGYGGARAFGEYERREAVSAFALPAAVTPDQSDWSPQRIAAWRAAVADGRAPRAVLRAPAIDLEVPVFAGTGERDLNRGAGHIAGTAAPGSEGNVGIAAHRDGYFRALQRLAVGDTLELTTHGGSRRYEVTDLSVVEPTEVGVLAPTEAPALTLVTCYPFYFVGNAPQRYVVRAVASPTMTD